MQVPSAGARTRNVINIVKPGSEGTVAYTWAGGASADSAPTLATQGYANFHRQRYLHILIKNNATGGAFSVNVWLYNSAWQSWGRLTTVDPADGGSNPVIITSATNADECAILDIAGAERVFVAMTAIGSGGSGTCFLGVNSF